MRSRVIQHLFNSRSLVSRPNGFAFSLKNRVGDFQIERLLWLRVDGRMFAPDRIRLAGELSLAAAISSYDWVASHERLGSHWS